MFESIPSPTANMPFPEVIERLQSSDTVRGIALFGSSTINLPHNASDYDLLILTTEPNVHIFQMHTWIDRISADIVFVESELLDRVMALEAPISGTSPEGFVISWMEHATMLYESEDEPLSRLQHKIREREWRVFEVTPNASYEDWFWLNFDLRHIQRLARSTDQLHLMTADIRLMSCFSGLCRVYFQLGGLAWQGEKAALRHLRENDSNYFALIEDYLQEASREVKVELCEQLIERTLESVGKSWSPNSTAFYLKLPSQQPEDINVTATFWKNLLTKS